MSSKQRKNVACERFNSVCRDVEYNSISNAIPRNRYPNIVKNFIILKANQLWVSDITYIAIWFDEYHYVFCYLSLVLDAYTEVIVGWSVGPTLDASYPIDALKMALRRIEESNDSELIHHSDRGCQYASSEYVRLLEDIRFTCDDTCAGSDA